MAGPTNVAPLWMCCRFYTRYSRNTLLVELYAKREDHFGTPTAAVVEQVPLSEPRGSVHVPSRAKC